MFKISLMVNLWYVLFFPGGEGFTHSHFVSLRTDSNSKCFISCQIGEFASWSHEWHRQGQSLFPLYKNQVHDVFESPASMSAVPTKRLLQMHFQGMCTCIFMSWNFPHSIRSRPSFRMIRDSTTFPSLRWAPVRIIIMPNLASTWVDHQRPTCARLPLLLQLQSEWKISTHFLLRLDTYVDTEKKQCYVEKRVLYG